MDGTGELYAKWNKIGGEGQIPYDLTYNWNLIAFLLLFLNCVTFGKLGELSVPQILIYKSDHTYIIKLFED